MRIKLLSSCIFLLSFMAQGQNLLQDITFPQVYYTFDIDFSQNCNDKFRHDWQDHSQVHFGWKKGKADSFQTYNFQFNSQKKELNILQLSIDLKGIDLNEELFLSFDFELSNPTKKSILKFAFIDKPLSLKKTSKLNHLKTFYELDLNQTTVQSKIKLPVQLNKKNKTLIVWLAEIQMDTVFLTLRNLALLKKGGTSKPTAASFEEVNYMPINIDYMQMNIVLNEWTMDTANDKSFFKNISEVHYKRIILNVHLDTFTFSSSQIDILKKKSRYYSSLLATMYPNVRIEIIDTLYIKAGKEDEYKTKNMGRIEFVFVKDF